MSVSHIASRSLSLLSSFSSFSLPLTLILALSLRLCIILYRTRLSVAYYQKVTTLLNMFFISFTAAQIFKTVDFPVKRNQQTKNKFQISV